MIRVAPVRGFTLIELVVVVLIVGILASIAYPIYTDQVRKGRRADAKAALVTAQQQIERCYTSTLDYTKCSLGSSTSENGFYSIAFATSPARTASTYVLVATAENVQTSDTDCAKFTLSNAGERKAYTSGDVENPNCW